MGHIIQMLVFEGGKGYFVREEEVGVQWVGSAFDK
jgi:hypothetical protein